MSGNLNPAPAIGDFDPPDGADLLEYFVQFQPDRAATPIAYCNWVRALGSRPQFVKQAPGDDKKAMLRTHSNRSVSQESSRNWSGAFVRPRDARVMARIQGRWVVPDTPPPNLTEAFASSVWIGFDGHDPASRLMPQIGTAQVAYNFPSWNGPLKKDEQKAWWQIWRRHDKETQQNEINIIINKKDKVYCEVIVIDEVIVLFLILNESTGRLWFQPKQLPADGDMHHQRSFERRTAEWVVERPIYINEAGDRFGFPLAPYGQTTFGDCNVVTVAPDGSAQEFQLQRANLIRMHMWDSRADFFGPEKHPGRLGSQPTRMGDYSVKMEYVPPPP